MSPFLLALAMATTPAEAYTVTTVMRLAKPYRLADMNDDFQRAKVLAQDKDTVTVEITHWPLRSQTVGSNPNWRKDDASMQDYLRPMPAANWDADMRKELLRQLRSESIDPKALDDKTLVERVSRWAMRRSKFVDAFGIWMVEFPAGKPQVAPSLRNAFTSNEPKGVSDADAFQQEVLGKGMFERKSHGTCTSSATYLATILRALGIPTRIVFCIPSADPNDPKQVEMLGKAIRLHRMRRDVQHGTGSSGFTNHVFNEVWVGKHWVRLNYDRLGQPIVDSNYLGLMTHVLTAKDISEVPLAQTWGRRYATGGGPKLSSINPCQLMRAWDNLAPGVEIPNPPLIEMTRATITGLLRRGDAKIPSWLHWAPETDALLTIGEWNRDDDYHQLRQFAAGASDQFVLRAEGHPDVTVKLNGGSYSDGSGTFQAYGLRLAGKPEPGVEYRLIASNSGRAHEWIVGEGVRWNASK